MNELVFKLPLNGNKLHETKPRGGDGGKGGGGVVDRVTIIGGNGASQVIGSPWWVKYTVTILPSRHGATTGHVTQANTGQNIF